MRWFILPALALLIACGPDSPPAEDPPDLSADADVVDAPDTEADTVDAAPDLDVVDATPDADAADTADAPDVPDIDADAADLPDIPNPLEDFLRPPDGHPTEVFVGGHADDDLLFMNPDILHAIRAGHAVRTVIITGGDACGTREPADREAGLRAAYGRMVTGSSHTEDDWTCGTTELGVPVVICGLDSSPPVSLVFPRAPDCAPALLDLVEGRVDSLESVSAFPAELTVDGLIDMLVTDLRAMDVVTMHTLESSDVYGHEHDDHIASARLAYLAAAEARVERYREHRTYNVDGDPTNVHEADLDAAWDAITAYCDVSGEGEEICVRDSGIAFWEWARRQYPVERLGRFRGRLGNDGRCITPGDGVPFLGPCNEAPQWQVHNWTLEFEAGCLWTEDRRLGIGPCDRSVFSIMTNGQIRTSTGDLCLEAAADEVIVAACAGTEDGVPVDAQRWHLAVGPIHDGGPFSDEELEGAGQRSLQAGVAPIGVTELCIRANPGVMCSRFDGARWSAPLDLAWDFSTWNGWWPFYYAATIRVLDLNRDGRADVCGRGVSGVWCGLDSESGFGPAELRNDDPYFSNAAGDFWFDPAYYRSFGFAYLGEEWPHMCARTIAGVSCAPPTGEGRWGHLIDVVQSEFSNEHGWHRERYGATIRYGDIDGDGLDDVCGRGSIGLLCALGTTEGLFRTPRFWGFRDELADRAIWTREERYTGAFQLIDLNQDGRADACMRSPEGVVCGWSTGTTFGSFQELHVFSDDDGFADAQHGAALVWDLASERVCARRSAGLVCAEL